MGKKRVFTEVEVGKDGWSKYWMQPKNGHHMACCDCHLVHVFKFRLVKSYNGRGKVMQWKVKRDNRSTAALRREALKRAVDVTR